jgi:hypothetical protein
MADRREYYKQWRAENPERVKALDKVKNDVHRKRYANDPEFAAHWKRVVALGRYKMTPKQYEEQLAEQGGHCALCPISTQVHSLHVDHDHECCDGVFTCGKCRRGILCTECNVKLSYLEAMLKDTLSYHFIPKSWTSRAVDYLAYWHSFRLGPNA